MEIYVDIYYNDNIKHIPTYKLGQKPGKETLNEEIFFD